MSENKSILNAVDGKTLMETEFPPLRFCVDTLLPQGLCILGGASKIGKSWLMLDLCVRVAKGESIWDMKTDKGTTLYLCLEDTLRRVQNRLLCITDNAPSNVYFATSSGTLADGLCEQIADFVKEHSDTRLVVIDTFQIVRNNGRDISYGNDYDETRQLKELADRLDITILLVHHVRKKGDADPFNTLTGTTGISGAVDAMFVLEKSKRNSDTATMHCTGRDIEDRQLELKFSREDYVWELIDDSIDNHAMLMPSEMELLVGFMKERKSFNGSNTEFTELFNLFAETDISVKGLKQMMNQWSDRLKACGVSFKSTRSNGARLLEVSYSSPAGDQSAVSDETTLQ